MEQTTIATPAEQAARARDLVVLKEKDTHDKEEARKNKGFTQVYGPGWKRIRELSKGNPGAAGLYAFFAEHIDPTCGAVVCDQQFLADQFEISTRTVRTWLKYLEEQNAILKIPVAGRVCAYALDPHEVWKSYDNSKNYAAFRTKTLTNKDGHIQKRIMSMLTPDESESP